MATITPVPVTLAWTLVQTGVALSGMITVSGGPQVQVYFTNTNVPPAANVNGSNVLDGAMFAMNANEYMWARSLTGLSTVLLQPNLLMPVMTPLDSSLVVQTYLEYNVKKGTQFEAATYASALAVGANIDVIFQTGAKPVAIKFREIQFDSTKLQLNLYRGPTFTGGIVAVPFNLTDINPLVSTVTVRGGATVTAVGTQIAATRDFVGSDGQGISRFAVGAAIGLERDLLPNTFYLSRITNTSAQIQQVSSYTTWYEGLLN